MKQLYYIRWLGDCNANANARPVPELFVTVCNAHRAKQKQSKVVLSRENWGADQLDPPAIHSSAVALSCRLS